MLGPYSIENLRERNLKSSDLIWYEGLSDWTPAGNLIPLNNTTSKEPFAQPKQKFSLKIFFRKIFSLAK